MRWASAWVFAFRVESGVSAVREKQAEENDQCED